MASDAFSFTTTMTQIPADRVVNVSNISALIQHIEQEPDAIMSLDPCKYTAKLQRKGKWKWRDNINTTREMSGFLVGEVSDESQVGLIGDRLVNFFSGVRCLIVGLLYILMQS